MPNAKILNFVRSASPRVPKSAITDDGMAISKLTAGDSRSGVPRQREDGLAGKSSRCSMPSSNMDLVTGYDSQMSPYCCGFNKLPVHCQIKCKTFIFSLQQMMHCLLKKL